MVILIENEEKIRDDMSFRFWDSLSCLINNTKKSLRRYKSSGLFEGGNIQETEKKSRIGCLGDSLCCLREESRVSVRFSNTE